MNNEVTKKAKTDVALTGMFEADQKERGIKTLLEGANFGTPNLDFCHMFGNSPGECYWAGYGIDSIFTYLNAINNIFTKNKKFNEINCNKTALFKDGLVSTKVVESAVKSLKNNSKIIKVT